jgi:hypothetical protein
MMVSGNHLGVLAREINLKGRSNLSYQTSVGKRFLEIVARVDTLPLLALSHKTQIVILKHVGPKELLFVLTPCQIFP